jgi:hypothetical protein
MTCLQLSSSIQDANVPQHLIKEPHQFFAFFTLFLLVVQSFYRGGKKQTGCSAKSGTRGKKY